MLDEIGYKLVCDKLSEKSLIYLFLISEILTKLNVYLHTEHLRKWSMPLQCKWLLSFENLN